METTQRTILKAISWQSIGIIVMTAIGYIHTGSFGSAMSLAGSTLVLSSVIYIFHEKLWQRISWGKTTPAESA